MESSVHHLKVETQNSNHLDSLMEVVPLLLQGEMYQMSCPVLMQLC